ncbi:MAG: queuosine precursor transporter [Patescibacteria group bacterium]|jgi:hypothetical protein
MDKKLSLALVSASAYTSAQIIANVLSTKITVLPLVHLSMDAGTIIYPITFTLRDLVHKTCGKKNSRVVVVSAAAFSLLAFLFFWLAGKMAPDPAWLYQNDYQNILMPVFRISIASVIAQVLSELADTEIFSMVYRRLNDILAVLISNTVALVIDSAIFSLIAFLGVLPISTVMEIMVANILVKAVISLVSSPAIKFMPKQVETEEI